MLWSDSVYLIEPKCCIHGPFNYDDHADIIQPTQHVNLPQ